MSVQSEINRINTAKSDIATAITNKGVAVPSGTKLDGMAALIDGIESGGGDPVLLWTNASPKSTFLAQTVTLPTGYSGYIVELRLATSNAGVLNRTFVPNNGGALCAVSFYAQTTGNVGAVRNAIGTESSIEFSYGKSASSNTHLDEQAIPTRIWGVKFTL